MDSTNYQEATFGPRELHKRKRTKRQRSQSLSRLPCVADDNIICRALNSSDSTPEIIDSTFNEEEDMANCLMLLSRGGLLIKEPPREENDPKFSSKRYLEKAGYFVYQCKTCDKSFPSFQALGGHRASHKKPKNAAVSDNNDKRHPLIDFQNINNNGLCSSDDEDVLSLQLMMNNNVNNGRKLPAVKVHECSICGAEFSSGQALGGHMRRHRLPPIAASSSLTPPTPESEERPRINQFGLDLNQPAPEDDQESGPGGLSFGLRGPDRSGLVLSIPALVGCHY